MSSKTKNNTVIDVNQLAEVLKTQGIEVDGLEQLFASDRDNNQPIQEFKNCRVIHTANKELIKTAQDMIKENHIVAIVDLSDSYGATKKGNKKGYGTTAGFISMTIKNKGKKEDIGINVTVSSKTVKG